MIQLYPDQLQFVDDLRSAMRTHRSVLAHAATGFGKTQVAAYIAKTVAAKGRRVLFSVHRRNLLQQSATTFAAHGIDFGYIAAGYRGSAAAVQLASIETLRRRLAQITACDLLYIDECHLACSKTWTEVIEHFRGLGARIIGNTATPCRLDGRPLGQHFDVIVPGPPVRALIEAGRLSDYRVFAPSAPNLDAVHTRQGEYVTAELEAVMDRQIVGDAAKYYHQLMPGRRALAFCVSIKKSQEAAEQFRAAGIAACHIDGETPDAERQRVIRAFADGQLQVLTNVDLVTTGFDLSAQVGREVPVEGGIILRPTQSLSLHIQIVGRMLRRKPEPAIINDHAGNALRHATVAGEGIEWSLDGKPKKPKETALALRTCETCFAVFSAHLSGCPSCGKTYATKQRGEPEQVDGELRELDPEVLRRRREEGRAQGLRALVELALARGYKVAWAGVRHALRTKTDRAAAIKQAEQIARELTSRQPSREGAA